MSFGRGALGTWSGAAVGAPPPSGIPSQAPQTSALAVTAFILSFIPVCLNMVGLVLGVIALFRIIGQPSRLKGKGLAIAAIVLPVVEFVGLFFVGMASAIAIPNFVKFQHRARQTEARVALRSIYQEEKLYELDHNQAPTSFAQLNLRLPTHRSYAYFLGQDARQPDRGGPYQIPPALADRLRNKLAIAVGNLDRDRTLDVWAVDQDGKVEHVVDDERR